ncbi:MAG: prepilin-type N-terminal cleavage/methylation domain-containing protein [Desulfobulbus sp.]|nr:prepilin-type N-terminal cleavage/methylation domain-containing protein [Desulfobulbus sp.]
MPSEVEVVKACRYSAGFTLLEVMIAVAIIAISVVTLLGAQSQSVSIASGAKFETTASMLAQWKMSDLLLQEFTELADDEGNFGEDYPQYFWKLIVSEPSESETGIPGTADQIKTLDITVLSNVDKNREFSLRTFAYNRPKGAGQDVENVGEQPNAHQAESTPESESAP